MYINGFITFVLVVLINVFYVYYIQAIKNNNPLIASSWASCINLFSSIAAIYFIKDNWIIIPSCFGSFVGTYIGMLIEKKK
jgi:hypothetical protein